MRKPKERDLYAQVIDFLALHRIPALRLNAGLVQTAHGSWVRLGPKGASDVVACLPPSGRWLCVECKLRARDRATPAQAAWLSGMEKAGALVLLVRDVRELEAALKAEGVIR
jgi:hypothetical protein